LSLHLHQLHQLLPEQLHRLLSLLLLCLLVLRQHWILLWCCHCLHFCWLVEDYQAAEAAPQGCSIQ
jgi:hypothetical protein